MADETAKRLYNWEERFVEPRQKDWQRLLSKEQCEEFVKAACFKTGTRLPFIRFNKMNATPCKAVPGTWEILIAEWGRSAVTILHETAHLATIRAVIDGENPHGASFARQAIEFYRDFVGIDEGYLLETAARCGVSVGPPTRPSIKPSIRSEFEEDF